jgi:hypothetical protein
MKVNIDDYKVGRAFVQKWYLEKGNGKPAEAASIIATAIHTPIIVVAFWIGEVDGWSPETLNTIARMVQFYKYTEVLGKPDTYPGDAI